MTKNYFPPAWGWRHRTATAHTAYLNFAGFLILLVCTVILSSCGGSGTTSQGPPPPPATADFSMTVDVQSVTAQQGGALQWQAIRIHPAYGFKGTVSFALSGLPAGVTVLPLGALSAAVGGSEAVTTIQLAASPTTPLGTTTATVTAASGTLTHTATFSFMVTQAATFAIQVAPSSISLTPVSSATVQVSATTNDGTSPQLRLNVNRPPNESDVLMTYPQGFLTPGNPLSFSFTATEMAQPLQSYPVTITASGNSANTAAVILPVTVTVPFASNTTPTRSTFVRTDKSPTGMVYDRLRKLLFVSVETLNVVQVLSATDGHQVASIPVNYPSGIDEAADGSAIYVMSPYFGGVTIIDPNLLQVVGHTTVPPAVSPVQPLSFFQVAALSNGKVALLPAGSGDCLLWDPKADSFRQLGPSTLQLSIVFISRSADHSKLLGYAGPMGTGIIYDANTDSFSSPTPAIGGSAAVNGDGSQIASVNSLLAIEFYDSSFNLLGSVPLHSFWLGGTVTATYLQHRWKVPLCDS